LLLLFQRKNRSSSRGEIRLRRRHRGHHFRLINVVVQEQRTGRGRRSE
jgi:hypothetical protein